MEIEKYEKLPMSHLLEYFAGLPYWKKEERENERERNN